jgi:hypothetical protein
MTHKESGDTESERTIGGIWKETDVIYEGSSNINRTPFSLKLTDSDIKTRSPYW